MDVDAMGVDSKIRMISFLRLLILSTFFIDQKGRGAFPQI